MSPIVSAIRRSEPAVATRWTSRDRQPIEEPVGHIEGLIDADPTAAGADPSNSLQHVLLGLLGEPLEAREPAVFRGGHEFVEPLDAELLVHDHRLLGSEAGDGRHLSDARGNLGAERFELRERPRVEVGPYLLGDRLPDVRDRPDPRRRARRGPPCGHRPRAPPSRRRGA